MPKYSGKRIESNPLAPAVPRPYISVAIYTVGANSSISVLGVHESYCELLDDVENFWKSYMPPESVTTALARSTR